MADYDLAHMSFDQHVQNRITVKYYEAGHGLFMDNKALPQISNDLAEFYAGALGLAQTNSKQESPGAASISAAQAQP